MGFRVDHGILEDTDDEPGKRSVDGDDVVVLFERVGDRTDYLILLDERATPRFISTIPPASARSQVSRLRRE